MSLLTRLSGRRGLSHAWFIAAAILVAAAYLGLHPSPRTAILLAGAFIVALVVARPVLILALVVAVALLVKFEINTGTDVMLHPVALAVPAAAMVWVIAALRRRAPAWGASRVDRPLVLFLGAGVLSLLVGDATWDPAIRRSGHFTVVQLAQWAVFVFSACAFWLAAAWVADERQLKRLTALFMVLAGCVAVLRLVPVVGGLVEQAVTQAFIRTPLWVLLASLAGGQLLFNTHLSALSRLGCLSAVAATLIYAFFDSREYVSNWAGVAVAGVVLLWLRFPRMRLPAVVAVTGFVIVGSLLPAVYEFAGGDAEWQFSGTPRLLLAGRVFDVTWQHNPVTGLGPASYRLYAGSTPLEIGNGQLWVGAVVSSHNNYVDLFAHTGVLGLGLFLWCMAEMVYLAYRLHKRHREGFLAGYVSAMLAVAISMLAIMMLADWFLPFVYNVSFGGFQASVLVWLFLGGLAAIENMPRTADQKTSYS